MEGIFSNAILLLAFIIITILAILLLVKFAFRNLPNQNLTLYLDFIKWIVVSVALVIIADVVDSSLKDRQAGLNEISQYDKYQQLVIATDKIGERYRLAQFLSEVTASKILRDRWIDYFKDVVKKEYKDSLEKLTQATAAVDSLKIALKNNRRSDSTQIIDSLIQDSQGKVNTLSSQVYAKITVPNSAGPNPAEASSWEEKGFDLLVKRDVNGAIDAFNNAEQSYNGYHMVYDIRNYLKTNSGQLIDASNNAAWKKAYDDILKNFSWKMPDDAKEKLKSKLGSD